MLNLNAAPRAVCGIGSVWAKGWGGVNIATVRTPLSKYCHNAAGIIIKAGRQRVKKLKSIQKLKILNDFNSFPFYAVTTQSKRL